MKGNDEILAAACVALDKARALLDFVVRYDGKCTREFVLACKAWVDGEYDPGALYANVGLSSEPKRDVVHYLRGYDGYLECTTRAIKNPKTTRDRAKVTCKRCLFDLERTARIFGDQKTRNKQGEAPMTSITIAFDDGSTHKIEIGDIARETIRYTFNPSGLHAVNVIKSLTGALITEIETQKSQKPNASWQFGKAIEHATSASMWAVLAATKSV